MKSVRTALIFQTCSLLAASLGIFAALLTLLGRSREITPSLIWGVLPLVLAVAAGAGVWIANRTVRSVDICTKRLSRLAQGDLTPSPSGETRDSGLLRELDGCVAVLRAVTGETTATLDAMAAGDLSSPPSKRFPGDFDAIRRSLRGVHTSLNGCVGGIAASARQVAVGVEQISHSSGLLSKNAADEAISVSSLSQSMALVADRAMQSTNMAHQVAHSGADVKQVAEVGAQQMDRMMQSVQAINEAGKSIESVIKIIEDIAFQTNILALNAAVEAARAGQHGKGFAVVADEVRNLASKSAEAAQDTARLISETIRRADEGHAISLETRHSLEQIMEGIETVTSSIVKISESSDVQSEEIRTVNDLLKRHAHDISANSAASGQAAIASQGAKEFVDRLQGFVKQFRLEPGSLERAARQLPELSLETQTEQGSDDSIYKGLVWSDDLKMGDSTIDGQHKQLIEMVDELMSACFHGAADKEINKVMSFLLEYTVKHFADEEALQLRCRFPGYRQHKKIHDDFKAAAVGLAEELEETGPTVEMIGKINQHLAGWLLNHIKEEDKRISRYLRQQPNGKTDVAERPAIAAR